MKSTPAKSAPKLPAKREVPNGKPPRGFRFLCRNEVAHAKHRDEILNMVTRRRTALSSDEEEFYNGHIVGQSPSDMTKFPFIRPLAHPKRAQAGRIRRTGKRFTTVSSPTTEPQRGGPNEQAND